MQITPAMIKGLREKTGAGIMDCKEALTASEGSTEDAIDYLRKKGLQSASKRSARSTREGVVGSYIHGGGRLGVLVEVNCETDFVARTDDFEELVRDIAMQIAASNPQYISRQDIADDDLDDDDVVHDVVPDFSLRVDRRHASGKISAQVGVDGERRLLPYLNSPDVRFVHVGPDLEPFQVDDGHERGG